MNRKRSWSNFILILFVLITFVTGFGCNLDQDSSLYAQESNNDQEIHSQSVIHSYENQISAETLGRRPEIMQSQRMLRCYSNPAFRIVVLFICALLAVLPQFMLQFWRFISSNNQYPFLRSLHIVRFEQKSDGKKGRVIYTFL